MSLPSATNGTPLTTHTCVNAVVEHPFRDNGDSATKVYAHTMQGKLSTYVPLSDNDEMTSADEKPPRSPFPDDANAFYVGDTKPQPIDGGMVEYVRTFANIPSDRTVANGDADPFGLYAFEFPDTNTISDTYISTGAESFSHDAASHTSTVSFNLSGGDIANLEVGDKIAVKNTASSFFVQYDRSPPAGATSTIYLSTLSDCIITIKTASKITCEFVWNSWYDLPVLDDGDDYNGVPSTTYEAVKVVLSGRSGTLQSNSPAFIESTYIKSDDIYSINDNLKQKFAVYTSDGSLENGQDLSATTIPTNDEYGELVVNGLTINGEDQTIDRWKGNIFELKTIKVIAK